MEITYTPLCALAEHYGTDKRPEPLGHGYTHYYHSLFADRRESIRKVMEIGIDVGASLRMWRDYFPNATIYGVDVDPNKLITEDRIQCFLCDQSSESALIDLTFRVGDSFDLIIDDGSHRPHDQITTANVLIPSLTPGGIYVIEDVLEPRGVTPHLPCESHVEYFKVERDPWSKLMVIHAS